MKLTYRVSGFSLNCVPKIGLKLPLSNKFVHQVLGFRLMRRVDSG